MKTIVKKEVLDGVGKKTRNDFLNGKVSASKVESIYAHNLKEADNFSLFGLTINDLRMLLRNCHNPILKARIKDHIMSFKAKLQIGNNQNQLSIEKLHTFLAKGLKRTIRTLKKEAKRSKDKTLKVVSALLEAEFANLCAKTYGKQLKEVIYERKSLLLDKVAYWLDGTGWKYGYNANCGKNAAYIIYVYLPNGVQLSWHSTDYNLYKKFPYIETTWDGKVCSTMEKLLEYVKLHYAAFFTPATVYIV